MVARDDILDAVTAVTAGSSITPVTADPHAETGVTFAALDALPHLRLQLGDAPTTPQAAWQRSHERRLHADFFELRQSRRLFAQRRQPVGVDPQRLQRRQPGNGFRHGADFVAAEVEEMQLRELDQRRHVLHAAAAALEGVEIRQVDERLQVVEIPVEGQIELHQVVTGDFDQTEGDRQAEQILVGERQRLFAARFSAA